ncbi:unnamed protein product [Cuscuta epithymum]|uniref:Uncharacterized protein n=1 Tax=Cuscuta epithymum TaxID=186058 RepID=A0AAV0FI14_9ASTE|nr:unnamed protein product [Cuscuta epithymum]
MHRSLVQRNNQLAPHCSFCGQTSKLHTEMIEDGRHGSYKLDFNFNSHPPNDIDHLPYLVQCTHDHRSLEKFCNLHTVAAGFEPWSIDPNFSPLDQLSYPCRFRHTFIKISTYEVKITYCIELKLM